jgi:membrane protease YdiL (CAAX protease family)
MKLKQYKITLQLLSLLSLAGIVFKTKSFLYQDTVVYDNLIKAGISIATILLVIFINYRHSKIHYVLLATKKPVVNWLLCTPLLLTLMYLVAFTKFSSLKNIGAGIILLVLLAILLAAAAEEFIFRYMGVNYLLNRGFSIRSTALISSFFFAIAHISNISNSDWLSITNQTLIAFMLGIIAFCLVIQSNNFYTGVLFHFLVNIPIGLNRLVPEPEAADSENTILTVLGSLLIIQVVYFPLTVAAFSLYTRLKKIPEKIVASP